MSEIKSLVTAEAVKEVLRSEEVRSALKQQLRQNLEARLDAEVDAILDELLGAQPEPSPELLPEPQAEDVTTENGDGYDRHTARIGHNAVTVSQGHQ